VPSISSAPTECGDSCDGNNACPIPLPADVTIECGSCIEYQSCDFLGGASGSGKHSRLVFYLPLSTPWLLTFISFFLVMYVLQLLLASNLVLDFRVAFRRVSKTLCIYIRLYFLTSANSPSCLIYLTGADSGSATIGEGSWYVVLMMMRLISRL
jgi:hypothetical protein